MLDLDKLITHDMTLDDLDDVCEMEKETFTDPWPRQAFINDIENETTYCPVVRDEDGNLLAYANLMTFAEEAHLTNVAVRKSARRMGIGRMLVEHLIDRSESSGCFAMFLDVRASNEDAIRLYRKLEFSELYRRRRYYRNPVEDAVVMVRPIGERYHSG